MKAGAAGGIDAVVKAINKHIDNAGVCKYGCMTLDTTTCDNSKNAKIKQLNENENEMNSCEQSEGRSSRRN